VTLVCSGLSALSSNRRTYAFTNLLDGIELYSATTLEHQLSIAQAVDPCNNVALGLNLIANTLIVSGGSDGVISVYKQDNGQTIARLNAPTSKCKLHHHNSHISNLTFNSAAVQAVAV
jgi:hypothetical protein